MRRIAAVVGTVMALSVGSVAPAGAQADAAPTQVPMTTATAYDGGALQVGGLALSPGRVTWSDNSVKGGAIWTRVLTRTSTGFTAGPVHELGTGMPRVITTDGLRTAWIAGGNAVVRSGYSTTVLPGKFDTIKISGLRLVARGLHEVALFDLRNGAKTDLVMAYGASPQADPPGAADPAVDLWGDDLIFSKTDDSVWVADLETGTSTQVAAPVVGDNYGTSESVYAAANHVGWMRRKPATGAAPGCTQRDSVILDLVSGATTVRQTDLACPDQSTYSNSWLTGLGVDGWVMYSNSDLPDEWETLMPWERSAPIVITASNYQYYWDRVVVNGPYLAHRHWQLEPPYVSLLAHPVPVRPQSLGVKAAATKVIRGAVWQVIDVVSAVPHTCAVDIRNGVGVVVRSLGCAAAWQQGEIRAVWDGKDKAGAYVPLGTYSWSIRAGNSAGSLLNSDGSTTPVTGTISVHAN